MNIYTLGALVRNAHDKRRLTVLRVHAATATNARKLAKIETTIAAERWRLLCVSRSLRTEESVTYEPA